MILSVMKFQTYCPLKEKMANKEDIKKRILEEEDFIKCPRSMNSLVRYLAKSPEEVEDRIIAKLLMLDEAEVQKIYDDAIAQLKASLGEK